MESNKHLNLSSEDYKMILGSAQIGIWELEVVEGEKKRLYCDTMMKMLLGAKLNSTPEECYEFHAKGMLPEYIDAINQYRHEIETRGMSEVQYKWRNPNGEISVIKCVGILDKNFKEGSRMYGCHQDITSRVSSKENASFLDVLSTGYFCVMDFDLVTGKIKVIKMNEYLTKLFPEVNCTIEEGFERWGRNDLSYEDYMASRHFWDLNNVKKRLKKTDIISHEVRTFSSGWVEVQFVARKRNEKGEVTDVTWLARVIDDNKRKELENAKRVAAFSRQYYSVYYCDIENNTFEEMQHTTLMKEMLEGKVDMQSAFYMWTDTIIDEEYRVEARKFADVSTIDKRFKTGKNLYVDFKNNYGQWTRAELFPVEKDEKGKIKSVIVAAHVIEEEKKRDLALEKARDDANKANAAKTDFLSAMSHDIRTPMNAIMGMVEITKHHVDDKKKVEDGLEKIDIAGNQLLSLVNDVLDISAIESGKVEIHPEIINVNDEAVDFENVVNESMRGKTLKTVFNIHDIYAEWIMIDLTRFNQIAYNLVTNAIKYTPDDGEINVEFWQEKEETKDYIRLKVSDNGIGMSEEFKKNMFDTFKRATDTRVNQIQGAGLGLSIVKKLVDMLGGEIFVESELDKGSTFWVKIPFEKAKQSAVKKIKNNVIKKNRSFNVLIAEDNDMNYEIAKELFEMNNVFCKRARDGKCAVEIFENSKDNEFDAIFMDLQMPIMDGFEATKLIRSSSHKKAKMIPIFAMTANAFAEDVNHSKEAGMDEHLSKPIDIDHVMNLMYQFVK